MIAMTKATKVHEAVGDVTPSGRLPRAKRAGRHLTPFIAVPAFSKQTEKAGLLMTSTRRLPSPSPRKKKLAVLFVTPNLGLPASETTTGEASRSMATIHPVPCLSRNNGEEEAITALPTTRDVPPLSTKKRKKATGAVTSTQAVPSSPSSSAVGGGDQIVREHPLPACLPAAALLRDQLRSWRAVVASKTRIINATLAFVRTAIGYESTMDEKARKRVADAAKQVMAAIEDGEPAPAGYESAFRIAQDFVLAARESRNPFESMQKRIEAEMVANAATLPSAGFAEQVRGFSLKQLAMIVGITGDLNLYAGPAKVWKRLCLAPFQHEGKNKAGSSWRREGGLSAEEWSEFGYAPWKSAIMFVVGDLLIKCNFTAKGEDGEKTPCEYRKLYDTRKLYEQQERPDLPPIAHHRRAQRVMVKELIKQLWKNWTGR